jgi:hypothetical protein
MSTLRVNRIEPRTGDSVEIIGLDIPEPTESPVRAYINFMGQGPIQLRNTKNISHVVQNSGGKYTVHFATPFSHNQYVVASSASMSDSGTDVSCPTSVHNYQTGSVDVWTTSHNANASAFYDAFSVCLMICGDE